VPAANAFCHKAKPDREARCSTRPTWEAPRGADVAYGVSVDAPWRSLRDRGGRLDWTFPLLNPLQNKWFDLRYENLVLAGSTLVLFRLALEVRVPTMRLQLRRTQRGTLTLRASTSSQNFPHDSRLLPTSFKGESKCVLHRNQFFREWFGLFHSSRCKRG